MVDGARILVTLGSLLLLGLLTDALGRRLGLPRVSLLVAFGIAIGPAGLGWLPELEASWFPTVANMALVMIGFLLGESLSLDTFRRHGRAVLRISLTVVAATLAAEIAGLAALGVPLATALLLAAIATATDPAASLEVVHEARARGPFARRLVGVVAVDDAWGLVVFAVAFAAAQSLVGDGGAGEVLAEAGWELGGALLVGGLLGVPLALLSGRVRAGEPTLAEALGMVFLCGGLALWLDTSFLLAAMAMGAVVANLARHHARPFRAIEHIEWPFMILFFVGSGASLELSAVAEAGALLAAYVLLRVLGRLAGAWLGSPDPPTRRWMGLALMPQAGVALGMGLVAAQRFPEQGAQVLPVAIAATVLFELVGPVCTRYALARAGELRRPRRRAARA